MKFKIDQTQLNFIVKAQFSSLDLMSPDSFTSPSNLFIKKLFLLRLSMILDELWSLQSNFDSDIVPTLIYPRTLIFPSLGPSTRLVLLIYSHFNSHLPTCSSKSSETHFDRRTPGICPENSAGRVLNTNDLVGGDK